jgi:hypothetical protein
MNWRKLSDRITGRFGLRLIKSYEIDDLLAILEAQATPHTRKDAPIAEAIVFSMDRAIQLHALLSSYFEQAINPVPIHLFYRTSSPEHQKSYDEVIEMFSNKLASVSVQKPFREKMIDLLDRLQANKMFFLVDDDVFIEKIDLNEYCDFDLNVFTPSMRLGRHLTHNYTFQKEQPLPQFNKAIVDDSRFLCWKWSQGTLDWQYLFSIDGNLFSTDVMRTMAKRAMYKAPNSFEGALLRFWWAFQFHYGVAYQKARIVNIPCNRVQTEVENIKGNIHQDFMLEQWNKGLRMDYRSLYGITNISAHQELEFKFTNRRK